MKKWTNMLCALALVFSLIGAFGADRTAANEELPFSDISKHWAKEAILKAYEKGILNGYPDGTFQPDAVVRVDEFMVMMLRAHTEQYQGVMRFDQEWLQHVKQHQPQYYNTIISVGRSTGFDFKTATTGYWAKPYIDFMYEIPFIFDFNPVFPKDTKKLQAEVTREGASYLLGEWFKRYEGWIEPMYQEFLLRNHGWKDMENFTDGPIAFNRGIMLMTGLINGYPDGTFKPQRYVTRAEAVTMVQRLRDPSLRSPIKPDLSGQYYSDVNGHITIFSDKYKHDVYHKLVELGKTHITEGYLYLADSGSMSVFESKDASDRFDYLTRSGETHLRKNPELGVAVGGNTNRMLRVMYPTDKKMPLSETYFTAILQLFSGNNTGDKLREVIESYEPKAGSVGLDIQYFKYNGRDCKLYTSGGMYAFELQY